MTGRLAAIAVTAATIVAAPTASAAETAVTGGNADWGVKESFRNYVTGPIASGSYKAEQGAGKNSNGTINFEPASGTYDPAGSGNLKFGGSVFFSGHAGQLEVRITDPRVEYRGDAGILYADVESKSLDSGEVEEYPNTDFGKLDLTGVARTDDGATVEFDPIPMTLTANGAKAFGGNYEEGEAMDPIAFEIAYPGGDGGGGDEDLEAGTVRPSKPKQRISSEDLLVPLAKVHCVASGCVVDAPSKLTATIAGGEGDGERVKVKVVGPATLAEGAGAVIEAKFKKGTAKLLADGGKVKLASEIALNAGSLTASGNAAVTVKGR